MLVISRKIGEEIVIGRDVVVRVVRLSQERAALAIEAPEHVRVNREEIWRRSQAAARGEPQSASAGRGKAGEISM